MYVNTFRNKIIPKGNRKAVDTMINYFGENLKKLRIFKGLSTQELGNELGVAQSTVSNWESGRKEPNFAVLQRISVYFGVSTDRMLNHKISESDIILDDNTKKEIINRLAQELYEKYESIPDKDKPFVENELIEYADYLKHKVVAKNKVRKK